MHADAGKRTSSCAHSMTLRSSDAEASREPSGDHRTQLTALSCASVASCLGTASSASAAKRGADTRTHTRAHGSARCSQQGAGDAPREAAARAPVAEKAGRALQMRTQLSPPAVANFSPDGCTATEKTPLPPWCAQSSSASSDAPPPPPSPSRLMRARGKARRERVPSDPRAVPGSGWSSLAAARVRSRQWRAPRPSGTLCSARPPPRCARVTRSPRRAAPACRGACCRRGLTRRGDRWAR